MAKCKFFLKIFIIIFPLMILSGILIDNLLFQGEKVFLDHFTSTMFTSLFYSFIMVFWHFRELKKAGLKNFTEENIKVVQVKAIDFNLDLNEILEKLNKDLYFKTANFNLLPDAIIFKTIMDNTIVKIQRTTAKQKPYSYKISSKPKYKITLLDFGANYNNITRLQQLLN